MCVFFFISEGRGCGEYFKWFSFDGHRGRLVHFSCLTFRSHYSIRQLDSIAGTIPRAEIENAGKVDISALWKK